MSSIITYKESTLTTVNNETKILETKGKWLEDNITISDTTQGNNSSSGGYVTQDQDGYIVLPSTGNSGGSGTTPNLQAKTNITPTASSQTITADNGYDGLSSVQINAIPSNYIIPTGNKSIVANGTGIDVANYATVSVSVPTSGGSAAQHTIYLEFSDSTNTSIPVYYDDALISTMITSYTPSTYNNKTIVIAELDNTEWYNSTTIPIGVQLIDYNAITKDYVIDTTGARSEQWYAISDYTPIQAGMTFSYTGCYWFSIGFYDSSQNFISALSMYSDGTQRQDDTNSCDGTLSGNKIPSNAAYLRITGGYNANSSNMSLIRTA